AALPRRDAQLAGVPRDHPRRVTEPVVQLALLQVVSLGVVPVVLGGEEPLEEVDPLEALEFRVAFGRHDKTSGCYFFLGPLSLSLSFLSLSGSTASTIIVLSVSMARLAGVAVMVRLAVSSAVAAVARSVAVDMMVERRIASSCPSTGALSAR